MARLGPNSFMEAKVKLFRAYEHIAAVREFAEKYIADASYQFKRDYVPAEDQTHMFISVNPLPANLSAIVGDAVSNLWHVYTCLWTGLLQGIGKVAGDAPFPLGDSWADVRAALSGSGLLDRLPGVERLFEENIRPFRHPEGNMTVGLLSGLESINRQRVIFVRPGRVRMLDAQWQAADQIITTAAMDASGREGSVFSFPPMPGNLTPLAQPNIEFQIVFGGLPQIDGQPVIATLAAAAERTKAIVDLCEERFVGSGAAAPNGKARPTFGLL